MSTTDDALGGHEEASQRDSGLPFHPIAKPRIDPRHTPFSQTAAFRTYGVLDPDPFGLEDLYVKALLQEQGFDGLPQVVTAEIVDRFVQAGEIQLFRGVSLAQHAEQFRRGPLFVGRGGRGGGIYAAGGPEGLAHAHDYALDEGGVVLRMTLKSGARTIDYEVAAQVRAAGQEALERLRAERTSAVQQAFRSGGRVAARRVEAQYDERETETAAIHASVGRYAVYMGYDAVADRETGVYLVLNRTALRVQREDLQ
jgi:hypothetical protein